MASKSTSQLECPKPRTRIWCCIAAGSRARALWYCIVAGSRARVCCACIAAGSRAHVLCAVVVRDYRHLPRVQPQRQVEVSKASTPNANREMTSATPRLRIREHEGRTKRAGPANHNQEVKRIGSFWDDIWHSASEDSHKQGNSAKDAPSTCGERGRLHFVRITVTVGGARFGRPQHQTAGAIGFGVPGIYPWPRRACGGRRVTAKSFQNQAGVGGGFGRPQNQTAGAIGFGVPGMMCWPRRAY